MGTFLSVAESQVINAEGMIELGHPHFVPPHKIMEIGSDDQLNQYTKKRWGPSQWFPQSEPTPQI